MKIFSTKIWKKISKRFFCQKRSDRKIFFMEEELQSALKTFLAEGDKVSTVYFVQPVGLPLIQTLEKHKFS